MVKKRTKKQKKKIRRRRQQTRTVSPVKSSAAVPSQTSSTGQLAKLLKTSKSKPTEKTLDESFFGFSPKLIYQDLKKTIIITFLVLGVLLMIFVYT